MMRWLLPALMLVLPQVLSTQAPAETRLLMLDQAACEWCERWDSEVGVVYTRTAEGRRAPLIRSNIRAPLPDRVVLSRSARFTPTFVLVEDGVEIGRIEGYPGEDFFYGMLQQLLERVRKPEG